MSSDGSATPEDMALPCTFNGFLSLQWIRAEQRRRHPAERPADRKGIEKTLRRERHPFLTYKAGPPTQGLARRQF
jgi:hypothetical protein|tara:strand:+ start:317 stop:541 length:225 start_codon:yes stop_codon:yes gene_type:complete